MLQIKVGGMWMVQMSLVHLLSAYEAATQTTVLTQSTTVNQQQGILGLGARTALYRRALHVRFATNEATHQLTAKISIK